MTFPFDETVATRLCEIMGRNQSDKGSADITTSWHNYTALYDSMFKYMQNTPLRLFELGVGTNNVNLPSNMGESGRPGASLYGWAEYFPNAAIFGADIDKDILFNTDTIHTFFCDQTNSDTIQEMWKEPMLEQGFDIIIDDGLNTIDANVCFFENSVHKLNSNGYYIIEDIIHYHKFAFEAKIKEWEVAYPELTFTLLSIPTAVNYNDNTVMIIHKQ
jgi:hypothetical protein